MRRLPIFRASTYKKHGGHVTSLKASSETQGQLEGAGKKLGRRKVKNEEKSPWGQSFNGPGARFSKLPVITGPVKLFCFSFQVGVAEGLKIVQ